MLAHLISFSYTPMSAAKSSAPDAIAAVCGLGCISPEAAAAFALGYAAAEACVEINPGTYPSTLTLYNWGLYSSSTMKFSHVHTWLRCLHQHRTGAASSPNSLDLCEWNVSYRRQRYNSSPPPSLSSFSLHLCPHPLPTALPPLLLLLSAARCVQPSCQGGFFLWYTRTI